MWAINRRQIKRNVVTGITLVLFPILRMRVVNLFARMVLKPLLPILPGAFSAKFPVVGEVRVQTTGSKVLRFATNGRDSIASRLYWSGLKGHESETMSLFPQLASQAKVFFDVGASTGVYSLIAAAHNPESQVHAFEAVPEIFHFLVHNTKLNGFSNLHPVLGCVTDYNGDATLYLNQTPALPFSTSHLKGYKASTESVVTPAFKLDEYVTRNDIQTVDLIKLDTEATEDAVLKGASDILNRFKPIIICEVLHRWPAEQALDGILESLEYKYFLITDDGLVPKSEIKGDPDYVFRNFLFVPESKVSTALEGLAVAAE